MKDLFLFRLNKLASLAGQPLVRLCEGRYGITRREWRLIVVLVQDGPMLSTELARRARIEPTRTSRTVTSLVSKGLALRTPMPSDRRCIQIEPTARARGIFDSLYPVVTALDAHLTDAITESDRAHLDRIFAKLESAAEVMAAGPDLPHANRRRRRTTGA